VSAFLNYQTLYKPVLLAECERPGQEPSSQTQRGELRGLRRTAASALHHVLAWLGLIMGRGAGREAPNSRYI
jgi:hypothetical protein